MKDDTAITKRDPAEHDVTPKVGDEGGMPGDVGHRRTHEVGEGSEADETWRPADREEHQVSHDETGVGPRNP